MKKRQKNSRAGRKAAQQQETIADESSILHRMVLFCYENRVVCILKHICKKIFAVLSIAIELV